MSDDLRKTIGRKWMREAQDRNKWHEIREESSSGLRQADVDNVVDGELGLTVPEDK